MKKTVSMPVAIIVVVLVLLALCGGLYKHYMYQPTYSATDIAAKYKAAASKTQAPPGMRGGQQNGAR